jgi:hypothetical protein
MITCRTRRMNFRLSKELDSIGVLSGSLGFLNQGCSFHSPIGECEILLIW